MIRRFKKNIWIQTGRSGRRKRIHFKVINKIFLAALFLICINLWCIHNYTTWILHREYDPKKDALVKKWIPSFSWFMKTFNSSLVKNNFAAAHNVLFANFPPENSNIPTVRLWVKNNGLEVLNQGIVKFHFADIEKKPRIRGIYKSNQDPEVSATINLRGTMQDHHQIWKPSLRIQFTKSELQEGFRNHVLIAPNDGIGFQNWLSNQLSSYWNMINNQEHFVRLYINEQFFGVYNRTWRLDESLLINSGRLPGVFFRLEPQSKRNFYIGNFLSWYIPQAWEVKGSSKSEAHNLLNQPFKIAQETLGWNTQPNQDKEYLKQRLMILNEYFDPESFAKYLAIICHSGENHIDNQHNNAFWMDSISGKLIPIVMDAEGYDWRSWNEHLFRPILKNSGAAVQAWLMNPLNQALYINKLNELTLTFGSAPKIEKMIRSKWAEIQNDVIADRHLSKTGSPRDFLPVKESDSLVEKLIEFTRQRTSWIRQQLTSDRVSISHRWKSGFELYLEGFSGTRVSRRDGKNFQLGNSTEFATSFELLPATTTLRTTGLSTLYKTPRSYAFYELPGQPEEYIFKHRLIDKIIEISKPPTNLRILRATIGINPLEIPKPDVDPVTLGPGEVIIEQTREYDVGQPVTIVSGTNLKLGAKASLIVRGPLMIRGNLSDPVIVRPLDPGQPFGVLAVFGKETGGTRIRYLDMEGGSIHRRFNLKFSGMLSIHDCPDVEILNSRFGKNFLGDDAVHIARSIAIVKNTVFENALFDSMDWDKVNGEVTNSHFLNSGNDGLDLSMGDVRVTSTRFKGCGDKCISAGEGVRITITGSSFHDGKNCIAVKDRSQAKLENNLFTNCRIAYHSYRKKWRWEKGGQGRIKNSRFLGSIEADVAGDKHSQIIFSNVAPKNLKVKGNIAIKNKF